MFFSSHPPTTIQPFMYFILYLFILPWISCSSHLFDSDCSGEEITHCADFTHLGCDDSSNQEVRGQPSVAEAEYQHRYLIFVDILELILHF